MSPEKICGKYKIRSFGATALNDTDKTDVDSIIRVADEALYRAKKMGLYPLFNSFAVLNVNGKNNGVYFQLEAWDENYLAKHELIDETDMFAFNAQKDHLGAQMNFCRVIMWQ